MKYEKVKGQRVSSDAFRFQCPFCDFECEVLPRPTAKQCHHMAETPRQIGLTMFAVFTDKPSKES